MQRNSKHKKENQTEQTEPSKKKKKVMVTRDSLVNGISEKGLSVNHKVKTVNLPGGTSKKILEKLDNIIKEKPDDLIIHVEMNMTNNLNLLANVKNISKKFPKNHQHPLHFNRSLNVKTR